MNDFDPVGEWMAAFPEAMLTPAAAGMIDAEVKPGDASAWRATIEKYTGNWNPRFPRDYNPRKIGNVLGVFREIKERQNGADRQFNNGIGAKGQLAIDGFNERRRIEAELRAIRPRNEADSR